MKQTYKEKMQDERPYWKVAVSLAVSLVGTILGIYVAVKLLGFFMPFVIGWILAWICTPIVNWLEKRIKLKRKLGSVLMIILVLLVVALICYGIGMLGVREISSLMQNMPGMLKDLEEGLAKIENLAMGLMVHVPSDVTDSFSEVSNNINSFVDNMISMISNPTIMAVGHVAKKVPSMLVYSIVALISAYFFITDKEEIIRIAGKVFPEPFTRRMTMVTDNLKKAVGGYFKAQFKIMIVIYVLLLVGLIFLKVHYFTLVALIIAVLDFLPFFGTGTVLLPWALYKLLVGNYAMAAGLLVLYGVTQVTHQMIQPKFVGDSIGMHPLLTLVLLYVGYRIGGIIAMIFAVPVGMIVINLYKAQAFDYILDDLKILIEGILSLRDRR